MLRPSILWWILFFPSLIFLPNFAFFSSGYSSLVNSLGSFYVLLKKNFTMKHQLSILIKKTVVTLQITNIK